MMATQYRATATDFTNKTDLLQEYFSCDGKSSQNLIHFIECDPKENPYNIQYVRSGAVPTGEDSKTYDLGNFSIATTGSQAAAAVTIGELWVTYEIVLRKPYNGIARGLTVASTHFLCNSCSTASPLGSGSHTAQYNFYGATVSSTAVTVPAGFPGKHMLTFSYALSTALTAASATATNATFLAYWQSLSYTQGISTANGNGQILIWIIQVTDASKPWSVTPSITLTGGGTMDLVINQLNASYA
jgi:hypothetical protein